MGSNEVISISNLSFTYSDGTVALCDINLKIDEKERVALLGANGAGKSTLLLHLNGLFKGNGKIEIFGLPVESTKEIRKLVGLVFQDPNDQLFMPTVLEDIVFGPLNLGLSQAEATNRAKETLKNLGLVGYENRAPHHLSLGERKKVAIAATLVMEPKILALDEPASDLDPRGKEMLHNILKELDVTLIIATHDVGFVATLCERAVVICAGEIMADGAMAEIVKDRALLKRSGLLWD